MKRKLDGNVYIQRMRDMGVSRDEGRRDAQLEEPKINT